MNIEITKLAAHGLTKRFGAVTALEGMRLEVRAGHVHGLVGANGAGKSTLVKILSGAITPDEGSLELAGWEGSALTPRLARKLGLATIYQDPGLAPTLGLVENVILGREHVAARVWLTTASQRDRAIDCLQQVGLERPLRTLAEVLSPAEQQLLGIARALFDDARMVIMDEPTAALGTVERERLFGVVRDLQRSGVGVLYISHHLDEVLDLCDVVTVMRDGRPVLEAAAAAELDEHGLVASMVGHEVERLRRTSRTRGAAALTVRGLGQGRRLGDVSFEVHEGEVLGVTGLVGSGRSRLARVLFGAERPTAGEMTLFGEPYRPAHPAEAIRRGVGLVPEDRKRDALLMHLASPKNITIARLPTARAGWLRLRRERRIGQDWIARLGVRPAAVGAVPANMSGGNQQKLVIARWMHAGARFVILDEPCQGVDVGARDQILEAVGELAASGAAVLLISQELEELQQLADRVLVMRAGRIAGELEASAISEAQIIPLAMGTASPSPSTEVLTP